MPRRNVMRWYAVGAMRNPVATPAGTSATRYTWRRKLVTSAEALRERDRQQEGEEDLHARHGHAQLRHELVEVPVETSRALGLRHARRLRAAARTRCSPASAITRRRATAWRMSLLTCICETPTALAYLGLGSVLLDTSRSTSRSRGRGRRSQRRAVLGLGEAVLVDAQGVGERVAVLVLPARPSRATSRGTHGPAPSPRSCSPRARSRLSASSRPWARGRSSCGEVSTRARSTLSTSSFRSRGHVEGRAAVAGSGAHLAEDRRDGEDANEAAVGVEPVDRLRPSDATCCRSSYGSAARSYRRASCRASGMNRSTAPRAPLVAVDEIRRQERGVLTIAIGRRRLGDYLHENSS